MDLSCLFEILKDVVLIGGGGKMVFSLRRFSLNWLIFCLLCCKISCNGFGLLEIVLFKTLFIGVLVLTGGVFTGNLSSFNVCRSSKSLGMLALVSIVLS